ncbi:helix-turn-helix transcriptional regulator [Streptomyces marianii]|uniref:Helix-turn-helix transcriptional regulator n=2 Tax=Streptomyces marianii TaxID=1817406 RepID=A0A5R9DSA5_9ACTN|nr:helix-turn-helix transcriptional regulator [Streptomyces marianii]
MTQSQLATALGCSRGAVSTWETTGRLPRPNRLQLLANVLGVPVSELIEEGESLSLHSLRLAAGMLQKDVARILKVTKSTYCKVERGRQNVPSRWFPILARTFGVPAESFGTSATPCPLQESAGAPGDDPDAPADSLTRPYRGAS